jgi:hypothetical protein
VTTEAAVLDLRTYRISPGGRDEFDRKLRDGALPLMLGRGIEVVSYGPSLVDDDHYYLARAFSSVAERNEVLDAFYGSDEWLQGYDEAVRRLVVGFHPLVVPLATDLERTLAAPE